MNRPKIKKITLKITTFEKKLVNIFCADYGRASAEWVTIAAIQFCCTSFEEI